MRDPGLGPKKPPKHVNGPNEGGPAARAGAARLGRAFGSIRKVGDGKFPPVPYGGKKGKKGKLRPGGYDQIA